MAYDLVARLRIQDEMSAKLRKVTASFTQMDGAVKQVTRATNVFRDANNRMRNESSRVVTQNKKSAESFNILGLSLKKVAGILGGYAIGKAAVGFISDSFSKAMDFEAQMSSIQALTGATNEEMAKMQALAIKMGAQTKYSALEAAQAIEELLKAGLTPASVQAGGLEAALNLATAGELGLADAAEIMATAMNAFRSDALSAAEASDILAGTANASATSVQELRFGLAQVSAVAAGVGVSFKDTNVALGLFANNGLKGSDAGTSLKTMLSNLQPTTKAQIELFKRLGLMTKDGANRFYDAKGRLKSLEEIAGILRGSLEKLTDQQRQLALETMFGSDAVRAGTILYKEGAEGVREFTKEMLKVTALDVAKKKMDNAAGAVEQFRGAIETLQISALLPTLPVLKDLALAAADFVEKYTPQITKSIENAVRTAKTYLSTHFFNNPEFQKLPDIQSKVFFVIDDLLNAFNTWLENGGQESLNRIGNVLMSMVANVIKNATPILVEVGLTVGKALAGAVLSGFASTLKENPIISMIIGAIGGAAMGSVIPGVGTLVGAVAGAGAGLATHYTSKILPGANSHYHGIDYVPRDRYPALLHKGERVVSAQENKASKNSGGVTIAKLADYFVVREEADIQRIARELAREIQAVSM